MPRRLEREPEGVVIDKIGVEAVDLTPELADNLGYKEQTHGALIAKVDQRQRGRRCRPYPWHAHHQGG